MAQHFFQKAQHFVTKAQHFMKRIHYIFNTIMITTLLKMLKNKNEQLKIVLKLKFLITLIYQPYNKYYHKKLVKNSF